MTNIGIDNYQQQYNNLPTYLYQKPLLGAFKLNFTNVEKKIHIGKKIKEKINKLRLQQKHVYTDMKLAPQSFYNYLKRPTIDTGILERFSKALGYNFFLDYVSHEELKKMFSNSEFVDPNEYRRVAEENENLKKELKGITSKYISLLEKQEKKELV